jgi:hypothetical protein
MKIDQLATAWLRRTLTEPAAMPGLTHATGSAQMHCDLCAVVHPVFPPYSGGNEITGVTFLHGRPLMTQTGSVEIRWRAYMVERRCQTKEWSFTSETRLVADKSAIVVRWKVKNKTSRPRPLNFSFLFSGRARNTGNEDYAWSVPGVPTDVFNMRVLKGLGVGMFSSKWKGALGFSSTEEDACSLQQVVSTANVRVEGQRVALTETVAAEAEVSGELRLVFALSKKEADELMTRLQQSPEQTWESTRSYWMELWKEAFIPDNSTFSGHMPVFPRKAPRGLSRIYYMGVLSLLCLRRMYPHSKLKPAYLTLGTRRGEGSIFLAWDLPYVAEALAMLDPQALLEHWTALAQAPLFGSMAYNLFKDEHVAALPCVADPMARYTVPIALNQYAPRIPWQKVSIQFHGKLVKTLGITGVVYEKNAITYSRSGLEIFKEAALCHRKYKLRKQQLIDFGDRGNYLECITTYAHGTAGHTAMQAFALSKLPGFSKSKALQNEHADLVQAIQRLYRKGEGYFDCLYPNGKRVSAANLYDLGLVLQGVGTQLPVKMVDEIIEYVRSQLLTNTWARCLAADDPDMLSGTRADHQWAGCFPAWIPQFLLGLMRLGRYETWMSDYVERVSQVTQQGPFAQAYWADDVHPLEAGGAAKCYDELPQGNHWVISSGVYWSVMALEMVKCQNLQKS